MLPLDLYLQAQFANRIKVRASEGSESWSRYFGGSIPSKDEVVENDQNFRNTIMSCNGEGAQQIISWIVSGLADGDLCSGDYDSFFKVFDHEREGAGCKGHGVSPMKDDEGIIL